MFNCRTGRQRTYVKVSLQYIAKLVQAVAVTVTEQCSESESPSRQLNVSRTGSAARAPARRATRVSESRRSGYSDGVVRKWRGWVRTFLESGAQVPIIPVSCENGDTLNGDPGSLFSRESRDTVPHIPWKVVSRFPKFPGKWGRGVPLSKL